MAQKITPHLWFDTQAIEAAEFYTRTFGDSSINSKTTMRDTPSGDCDIVSFTILGFEFMAISAGPLFKLNPSISISIACETKEEIDQYWERLAEGGEILMELQKYPFSERYGWLNDKYGLSWQFNLVPRKQKVAVFLSFVGENFGKAEGAMKFYASIFDDAGIGEISRYEAGMKDEGRIAHAIFRLCGQEFMAMESGLDHKFGFNEAASLIVNCKDQEEIDYYWEKLSAVPESEQCGWVKDRYGVSWQIVPENMTELLSRNPEKTTPAMLKMKKIDISEIEKAGR